MACAKPALAVSNTFGSTSLVSTERTWKDNGCQMRLQRGCGRGLAGSCRHHIVEIPDLQSPVLQGLSMQRFSTRSWVAVIVTTTVLVAACGGGGNGGTPPSTTAIAKTANSGNAQSATVGQPLANPIQVVVTENGSASPGVTVAWSTAAGGSLTPAGPTGADGIASSGWTLGTTSGAQTASATLAGATGSPVTFTATAAADAATTLVKVPGGDGQTGEIGIQLASPVQARVTDQHGNGVQGIAVDWAATGGTPSSPSVTSNASGVSSVNVTVDGPAGPIVITATAGQLSGSPLTFNATAVTPAPPGQTIQVLTAGGTRFQPANLTISAQSTVTWNWPAGSLDHNVVPDNGSTPATSGGLVDGPHTYSFTFDTPGTYRYYCFNHGGPGGIGMSGTVTVQ